MVVNTRDIRAAVRALDLNGQALCIHSSLRSFGWVDGGAETVVNALLAEGCTVLAPTFSWSFYAVSPPAEKRPARNGWNYADYPGPTDGIGRCYTPEASEIDREDMGAIPAAVLGHSRKVRGDHPLCSFSAVGPLAQRLVDAQRPQDLYAPFRELIETGGHVVLMGVSLRRMTLLHFAEKRAGRVLFRRWANGPDLQPMAVEAGGCSGGFDKFEGVLAPLARGTMVRQSRWRIFAAAEALEAAVAAIQRDPQITHCSEPNCGRCNDLIAGGPILG